MRLSMTQSFWRLLSPASGAAAVTLVASLALAATADECISLSGSTACSAFNQSSISTSSNLTSLFPFLAFVSDTDSFDEQLQSYISTSYAQEKYETLLGCSSVNLKNTTALYARYTTSVLCNAIVQNSKALCSESSDATEPLCADTCAEFAISEQEITASPDLCGTPGDDALTQIRADFTNCALPADSLSGSCIAGVENEPDDCGYQSNLQGLCSYCASSSPNATDSCCVNSKAEDRCENVQLPTTTSVPPLFPSSTSSSNATAGATEHKLSAGAIAGIVVGSILGALLLLSLVICACVLLRRRKRQAETILNQPSPARSASGPAMTYTDGPGVHEAVVPGARVARMSALEDSSSSSRHNDSDAGLGIRSYRDAHSSLDEYDDLSESNRGGIMPGPLPKRTGSLSSASALAIGDEHNSPKSSTGTETNTYSSPGAVTSGQSEQLPFFKDYYSQDEIRPNDTVATLWAYQPRAHDEFELERGDMLKVVGIWDDGWATGVKLSERAEEWEARRQVQRDSGVSNGGTPPSSGGDSGEIKAFPLVCVCLPQHWRKTIEGESSEQAASSRLLLPDSP